jgi:hypothetical protein
MEKAAFCGESILCEYSDVVMLRGRVDEATIFASIDAEFSVVHHHAPTIKLHHPWGWEAENSKEGRRHDSENVAGATWLQTARLHPRFFCRFDIRRDGRL